MFTVTVSVPWSEQPATGRYKEWHDGAIKLYNRLLKANSTRAAWRTWGDCIERDEANGHYVVMMGRWRTGRHNAGEGHLELDPHPATITVEDA